MSVTLNQGLKSYQESITHEIVDSYLFGDEEKSQILDIIMERA